MRDDTNPTSSPNQAKKRTIDKLAKICGMLGSAHDGERASAALLATQILDDLDITWRQLVEKALASLTIEEETDLDDSREPGWHARYCDVILTDHHNRLSDWEFGFVSSLADRYRYIRITEKQIKYFEIICKKLNIEVR